MNRVNARTNICAARLLAAAATIALPPRAIPAQSLPETRLAPPNAQVEHEFTRVGAVRQLTDGRVLVSDAGDNKLFVADFARQTVTQIGRAGQGPNEYTAVAALIALGNDSTLLPDVRAGRWLLLHGSDIVATVAADSPPLRNGARNPLGADHAGHVLAVASVRSLDGLGSTTTGADSLRVLRVSRATGRVDTLGKAAARPAQITVRGRDRAQSVSIVVNPLAVGEQVLLFPDGWVAVTRLNPYRVDWIGGDGRVERGAALPEKRVRVDEHVKRWVLEELAKQNGQPPRRPEDMPDNWPATIPPFVNNALVAATDGTLWIRRAATEPAAPVNYDVVGRQGRLVRRVVVAQNVRVVGLGPGAVYSTATDADGIQRLRRHAVVR